MSKTVDERVVSMQFDNKHFESNVQTTLGTLDKLKKSLNLEGAAKGLNEINASASKTDMSALNKGIETARLKFSALQVAGITALSNITNSAVDAGKKMFSALFVESKKAGFQEYETQMGAIQTILANTQKEGTNVEVVNKALDELNTYADKTIYNFTEMTRNIGTFTAAGVKLDTSVNAIKGIANLAAVSGSTSQQASTAMYQLSQALAAGKVQLMDWNSVVNAGMGGQVFQDALIRTSEHLKTGAKEAIATYGSFRESLTKGEWLTTEVLTETLNQISGAYSKADLMDQGYTEDQADAITQLADTAVSAATEVKTFTQLWDTLKEAAQSGWSATWRLVIGDFEQAKGRMTELSKIFGDLIGASADRRNTKLAGILSSKWDQVLTKVNAAGITTEDFQSRITEMAKSHDVNLDKMIKKEGSFEAALKKAFSTGKLDKSIIKDAIKSFVGLSDATGKATDKTKEFGKIADKVIAGEFGHGEERIKKLTEAGYDYATIQNIVNEKLGSSVRHMSSLTDEQLKNADSLVELSDKQLKQKGYTKEQITALRDLQKAADDSGSSINELIDNIEDPGGAELLWDSLFNILHAIIDPIKAIGKAWNETMNGMSGSGIYNIIKGFNKFTEALRNATTNKENLKLLTSSFKGLFAILDLIRKTIGALLKAGFSKLSSMFGKTDINILETTARIGDLIVAFHDWVIENNKITEGVNKFVGVMRKGIGYIVKWVKALADIPIIRKAIDGLVDKAKDLKSVGEDIIEGLESGLKNGIKSVPELLIEVGKKLISAIKTVLGIHSPSKVMFEIGGNIIDGLINGVQNGSSKLFDMFKDIASKIGEFLKNVPWSTVYAAAVSVGLVVMLKKLGDTVGALAAPMEGLGEMFSSAGYVMKKSAKGIKKTLTGVSKVLKSFSLSIKARALRNIAISIAILAGAVIALSFIDTKDLWKAVAVIGALAGILVALSFAIEKMSKSAVRIGKDGLNIGGMKAALLSIAGAILLIGITVKMIGNMDPDAAAQGFEGLERIVTSLIAITAIYGLLVQGESAKNIHKAGRMMTNLSISVLIMASAIRLISKLSDEDIERGETVILGFVGIVALLTMISQIGGHNLDKLGGTLLAMTVSMFLLVAVIKLISGLSPEELFKGGIAIAGFIGIIALLTLITQLAGKEMGKLGRVLISMSVSMILLIAAIKLISSLSREEIDKGLYAILGFAGIVAVFVLIAKIAGKDMGKVATTVIAMSIAVGVLAGVCIMMSLINPAGMAKGLIAVGILSAFMSMMLVAARGVNECKGTLIAMAVAIGVMAASVAILSLIDPTKLAGATASLSIVMGMFTLMIEAAGKLKKGMGSLIVMTVAIGVMATAIYLLAGLPIESVVASAASLSGLMLSLSAALMIVEKSKLSPTALIGVGIMAGVLALLGGILYLLRDLPVESTLSTATSLSVLLLSLSACCLILAPIGMVGPAALIGIGMLVALIGAVGGVVAAIGALVTKFPALEEFINTGIPILEKIGYALGSFFGNIIGGFTSGITAGLPQIGADLSLFMINALPFITGAKSVDPAVMDGIKALAEAILILTAADVIEGLTSWLTGGNSLAQFGAELVPFGMSLSAFSMAIAGVDAEQIKVAAQASKALAQFASEIPNSGGLVAKITGENSLAQFGAELVPFGLSLSAYGRAVAGIDPEVIKTSASAAKALTEFAATVPNTGGLVAAVTGDNDLATFGSQLAMFGSGLSMYSQFVSGIDAEQIKTSASAARSLTKFAETIPNSGGLLAAVTGDNDLATFGIKMTSFGISLKSYNDNVSGIDPEAIKTSASAAKALTSFAGSIPKTGGLKSIISGDNDIVKFGKKAAGFAEQLSKYCENLSGVNSSTINSSVYAAKNLLSFIKSTKDLDTSGIKKFQGAIQKLATTDMSGFTSTFSKASAQMANAASGMVNAIVKGINSKAPAVSNAMTRMLSNVSRSITSKLSGFTNMGRLLMTRFSMGFDSQKNRILNSTKSAVTSAANAIRTKYQSFYTNGRNLGKGLVEGIDSKQNAAYNAGYRLGQAAVKGEKDGQKSNSPSKLTILAGKWLGEGLVIGMNRSAQSVYRAGRTLGETASNTISSAVSRVADLVELSINSTPTIKPVLDLSDVRSGVGTINGLFADGQSIGVSSNISAISSMMSRRNQNGTTNDVISAIDKLRKDLGNVNNTSYTINGITYDDGSNISQAIQTLVRAAKVERRR